MDPFGKYKKVKTYRDILQEMTEDAKSYRRYLLSHYEYGSPQLRDLVKYLEAMAAMGYSNEDDLHSGPIIPVTSIARTK